MGNHLVQEFESLEGNPSHNYQHLSVLEHVEHTDQPAHIPPAEAQQIALEQHASWVEHNLMSALDGSVEHAEAHMEPILLLQFDTQHRNFIWVELVVRSW